MRLRIIDTETTGTEPEQESLVEYACHDIVHDKDIGWCHERYHSWMCNPGKPIPVDAMATHHIMDEDVADCPSPAEMIKTAHEELGGDPDYWVAHNAVFDRGFLCRLGTRYADPARWLDTYRIAAHLYPDAPGYGNQKLRYYLGIGRNFYVPPDLPAEAVAPHRALFDVIITTEILLKMLELKPIEELARLSDPNLPVLQRICRLKKYRDMEWRVVPKDYLEWVVKNPDKVDVDARHTAAHWLRSQGELKL